MSRKRIILLAAFLLLIVGLQFSGLNKYINFVQLKAHSDYLKHLVDTQYFISVLVYICAYIAIVALSLPLAALWTLAGGFLFGTFLGAIYANIGATIGAVCAFLMVRYLIGSIIQNKYALQLARFNQDMQKYGASYLLTVHFVAFIPFFVVNFLAGLTNVSLFTFIWTTSLGILPGALVYTFAGTQLADIHSMSDMLSFNIIFAFSLLALLALIPILIRSFILNR